jgi:hypothetical protein
MNQTNGPTQVPVLGSIMDFFSRSPVFFPQSISCLNIGEYWGRSHFINAIIWWAVVCSASGYFLSSHSRHKAMDIATIVFFYGVGFCCIGLQCLDLWRRELTHGTFILSRYPGTPRLPVGRFENAIFWFVPAGICLFFGLFASASIFAVAGIMTLFAELEWWRQWRLELLNTRDAHLIQQAIDSEDIKVIGLQASLRMAGSSGAGAIQHHYENLH